jgi:hypothetical protein
MTHTSGEQQRIEKQIAKRRKDSGFIRRITERIKGEDAAVLERLRQSDESAARADRADRDKLD